MKCCICGPVRNCGKYLDKVFDNIEKIGSLFDDYEILIVYDKSSDNTLEKLKKYQLKNPRLNFYINKTFISKYRTHRLAYARNFCLNHIKTLDTNEYPFFIMMDFDNVNCKEVNTNILTKYLTRTDWDGLSFNTVPKYYDIWALSIYPYCFSYNHFKNTNIHNYQVIQNYIDNKLKTLKSGELLRCISSFNGFSIYRTKKFLNTNYKV
jgi:glycosyltransferase involved in cell wall biosynthesis